MRMRAIGLGVGVGLFLAAARADAARELDAGRQGPPGKSGAVNVQGGPNVKRSLYYSIDPEKGVNGFKITHKQWSNGLDNKLDTLLLKHGSFGKISSVYSKGSIFGGHEDHYPTLSFGRMTLQAKDSRRPIPDRIPFGDGQVDTATYAMVMQMRAHEIEYGGLKTLSLQDGAGAPLNLKAIRKSGKTIEEAIRETQPYQQLVRAAEFAGYRVTGFKFVRAIAKAKHRNQLLHERIMDNEQLLKARYDNEKNFTDYTFVLTVDGSRAGQFAEKEKAPTWHLDFKANDQSSDEKPNEKK